MRKILNHIPRFLTPDVLPEYDPIINLLDSLGYFSTDDKATISDLRETPKKLGHFVSSAVQTKGEVFLRHLIEALRDGYQQHTAYKKLLQTLYLFLDRGTI